jgi:hypothetical protein
LVVWVNRLIFFHALASWCAFIAPSAIFRRFAARKLTSPFIVQTGKSRVGRAVAGDLKCLFTNHVQTGGALAGKCRRNRKGCDIGYALATSSCEEANSVDACTVAALDAITAFAVPDPNFSSQISRFFRVWVLSGLPRLADHSAYFGLAKFYLSQPFQPST